MESIIKVTQLPVIGDEVRLRELKAHWEQRAKDADATICTEENKQAVKRDRAELRKEFDELDRQRKAALAPVMDRVAQFNAIFKECATDAFKRADSAYKEKIAEIERGQKAACEAVCRDYFAEMRQVFGVDFVQYEQAGIKISLAEAGKATPTGAFDQISAFLSRVAGDVEAIRKMENSAAVMYEYQANGLSLQKAIKAEQNRQEAMRREQKAEQKRVEALERQEEAVAKVDAVAPPEAVAPPQEAEKEYRCTFTVYATKDKLKGLKQYMIQEGIKYE